MKEKESDRKEEGVEVEEGNGDVEEGKGEGEDEQQYELDLWEGQFRQIKISVILLFI